jgi:hypothetical protein
MSGSTNRAIVMVAAVLMVMKNSCESTHDENEQEEKCYSSSRPHKGTAFVSFQRRQHLPRK